MSRLALLRVTTLPFETLAALCPDRAAGPLGRLHDLDARLQAIAAELTGMLHRAAGERVPPADPDPDRGRARLALIALKRDVHNGRPPGRESLAQARPAVTAGLASLLHAYEELTARRAEAVESCRRACAADLAETRSRLPALASEPLVREGLRLASRSLGQRVAGLARRDPDGWGHSQRHVAAKVVSYLARFCTKTSPNGVFAATALAELGARRFAIDGAPRIERVEALLNIFEAGKVAACLAADPAVESAVAPRPNSTLRFGEAGGTFWKYASLRHVNEDETLCRVKDQLALRLFLEAAEAGARSPAALLDAVAERSGLPRDDLARFYRALVERGLLIAEVAIPYNARRPLRELASACRRAGCVPAWLGPLEEVEAAVDRLPSLDLPDRLATMDRIGAALEALPHNRPLAHDELLRVDAASALKVTLPERVASDLSSAMRTYVRLFAAMYPAGIYRRRFVTKFLKNHPPDTEVPLLDLYHGFVEPEEETTFRPAAFPEPGDGAGGGDAAAATMRRLRDFLARRAREGMPGQEVDLDETTVAGFIGDAPEPPWACGVLFQVAAPDAASLAEGRYRLVISSLFNGVGLALTRFSHLHGGAPTADNPIVKELRRAWGCVRREGAVMAEVTYNHHARTANAGLRPAIFPCEIEMPGETPSPGAEAIPLRDLSVRYDNSLQRFVLTWVARQVEVVPVISSGVDPVGITSFLVAIGQQGLQPVGYFPGFDLEGITRWPRVSCGRVVLFREQWVFRAGEWPLSVRAGAALSDADFIIETALWRRRHGLPRHLFVHTTVEPKPRYLDLDSPLFVDLLRRTIAPVEGRPGATLHVAEMYPGPRDLWIADERGRYPSEFLVQMEGPDAQRSR